MVWNDISEDYEVSSDGQIRNKHTGRVLRQFLGKDGYYRTQFDGKTQTVHRVVAKTFIPQDPGKDFINHKDGNKQNNNVDNLEWCTRSENMAHAYANNLKTSVGVSNGRCKLTADQVDFIRNHYIRGDQEFGGLALAKRFGVAHQTICAVATGQNWRSE